MRESALEGNSFCLVLVLAACADGLADCSGGMVALLVGGVLLPGVPLLLARLGGTGYRRRRARGPHKTGQTRSSGRILGKKKAVEVVTTPQRQVKKSGQASISRLYFTEAEGDCQIEF